MGILRLLIFSILLAFSNLFAQHTEVDLGTPIDAWVVWAQDTTELGQTITSFTVYYESLSDSSILSDHFPKPPANARRLLSLSEGDWWLWMTASNDVGESLPSDSLLLHVRRPCVPLPPVIIDIIKEK